MVIGESKVRATAQEYDRRYYVRVERLEWRGSWTSVATFTSMSAGGAREQAREAGWAWLVDQ